LGDLREDLDEAELFLCKEADVDREHVASLCGAIGASCLSCSCLRHEEHIGRELDADLMARSTLNIGANARLDAIFDDLDERLHVCQMEEDRMSMFAATVGVSFYNC